MPLSSNTSKPLPPFLILVGLLTILAALGQMSTSLYTPSFPAIGVDLQASPEQVNLTLAVFFFGFSFSQLIYGPLSDRFGRRRMLMVGITIYAVASLACAYASSIETLIALRFCQALGASAGPVLSRAVVRDLYSGDRAAQIFAYVGFAFAIVPALFPAIGGYLQSWFGWQSNFFFLTVMALIVGLMVWFILPETNKDVVDRTIPTESLISSYGLLLRNRVFLGYMLLVGGVFAGLMAFTASAPFLIIETLGISAKTYGVMIAATVVGFLSGTILAGRLAKKIGVRRMAFFGASLAVAGAFVGVGLSLSGIFNPYTIIGPMLIFLAGLGLVFPSGMAGAMEPYPRIAGSASGLMGCFQMLFATAGSMASGWIPHDTQLPLALLIMGCTLIGFIGLMALVKPLRSSS
ncbi:MAG: multidrug effflux MFS transporter [Alphaproteobacteria bacterium]|nr:multidrug effflux MFS transporter [Rhodospirillales bacterium]MCW9045904.1 multidrug effflux MFS transporter [Alphaproteobacteria bacterium]